MENYNEINSNNPELNSRNDELGINDLIPNCFDDSSVIYADTIKEFIRDEIRDSEYYRILARRAPTQMASRMFRQFSMDERSHARRFSAALYLITGRRYFPRIFDLEPVFVPSYEQALKQRFRAESKDAIKYPAFADTVRGDRCLKRLAIETGKAEEEHAEKIFVLIQEMD